MNNLINATQPVQQFAAVENMQIKMPGSFDDDGQYIPIGMQTNVNGKNIPAIPGFSKAPKTGTYVLGSIDGQIQWIETEECLF